ncbi:hypothetical protein SAMN05216238_101158 [Lentibacillus persicus]|uniref:SPW repeat-containing protein n=1 Tax=Lentibacillus persicus TaxID=640948 RepID=A0A1I1S025_9BACI|nr:hypothetical protein [Lentibacillus persicus]SFD39896.1 hypothetical protein SAMN05216238_101158 [Lentibacillus persicus]
MEKQVSKFGWGLLIIALILSAYILPYTILSDVQAWYGSFLVWGIIGVLIIIANIMITRDWGK